MGVHTGDSESLLLPHRRSPDREYQKMRGAAIAVMREIGGETGGSTVAVCRCRILLTAA